MHRSCSLTCFWWSHATRFAGATLQRPNSVRDNWPGFDAEHPERSDACTCITVKFFRDLSLAAPAGTRAVIDGGGRAWYGFPTIAQIGLAHIDGGLDGPKPALLNLGRETDLSKTNHSHGPKLGSTWDHIHSYMYMPRLPRP